MTDDSDILPFASFCLDPGKTSGYALARNNAVEDLVFHGHLRTATARRDVCRRVREYAEDVGLPLVVVAESWPGRWPSQKSALGMGRNWGRWIDHVELELGVKEDHILRVSFQRWRNDIYGPELCKEARESDDDDAWKKLAMSYAGVDDHNEAEAMCIAIWSQTSFEGTDAAQAALKRLRRAQRAV